MFFPVPILSVVSRFDCRKVGLNKLGARPPRTAYNLPVPPPAPAPSAAPEESQSTTVESQEPLDGRAKTPPRQAKHRKTLKAEAKCAPRPAWQSLTFDINAWQDTLDELKVDTVAQQELYLLAQCSADGAFAANHILSKVLKKIADGDHVRNFSAFVHACVKTERHDLRWKSEVSSAWHELE